MVLFTHRKNSNNFFYLFLALAISVWLSWRLLRMNNITYEMWYLYIYIMIFFIIVTFPLNFFYFFRSLILHQKTNKVFENINFIISFLLLIFSLQIILNRGNLDTFGVASLVFFLYFPLLVIIKKIDPIVFFNLFENIIIILIIFTLLDAINLLFGMNIFDYSLVQLVKGEDEFWPVLGNSHFIFENWRGRAPGVSGTVYATSALVGSATIYFFITKSYFKTLLSGFTLFILSSGSSVIIVLLAFLFIKKKNSLSLIIALIIITLSLMLISNKFGSLHLWLPEFHYSGSNIKLLFNFFLGDGNHASNFQFGELRGLSLIFSFGFIGFFLLIFLFLNLKRASFIFRSETWGLKYRGLFAFILVLFFSSWHYPTFMVFPNIFFLILASSFTSCQVKIKFLKE